MNEQREIKLWDDPAAEPVMKLFLTASATPRPLVVVLPGGGYCMRAAHEADPVALWLNRIGLHAAVCHYRVRPNRHPIPLMDAQRAIRTVRYNAHAWKVDPKRVGVLGFSAGGHLACSCANFGDDGLADSDAIGRAPSRVNALVSCYAAISFTAEFKHPGCGENLLGPSPDPELLHRLSLENSVTPQNPPTFIWHTSDDASVCSRHSLAYARALAAHKIPYALHVYPRGPHGIGLAETFDGTARNWPRDCAEWFAEIGWRTDTQK